MLLPSSAHFDASQGGLFAGSNPHTKVRRYEGTKVRRGWVAFEMEAGVPALLSRKCISRRLVLHRQSPLEKTTEGRAPRLPRASPDTATKAVALQPRECDNRGAMRPRGRLGADQDKNVYASVYGPPRPTSQHHVNWVDRVWMLTASLRRHCIWHPVQGLWVTGWHLAMARRR